LDAQFELKLRKDFGIPNQGLNPFQKYKLGIWFKTPNLDQRKKINSKQGFELQHKVYVFLNDLRELKINNLFETFHNSNERGLNTK
jgi:hypothetical protein